MQWGRPIGVKLLHLVGDCVAKIDGGQFRFAGVCGPQLADSSVQGVGLPITKEEAPAAGRRKGRGDRRRRTSWLTRHRRSGRGRNPPFFEL